MALNPQLQQQMPAIQACLAQHPVKRAWIFGSCSRGEEREDSDVDFLVEYDRTLKRISLFDICGLMVALEKVCQRRVDVVEEGRLMPFAVESANRDKIFIYERTPQGQATA